jgi:hypothetical protein
MSTAPTTNPASPAVPGTLYFDIVAVAFVSVYLISQVSSSKLFAIGPVQLPGPRSSSRCRTYSGTS